MGKREVQMVKIYVLLLAAFSIYLSYGWANAYLDAMQALVYYNAARGQLEAYIRTSGQGIDPAFTCKMREKR